MMIALLVVLLLTSIVAGTLDVLSSMKAKKMGFMESNPLMRDNNGQPSLPKIIAIKAGFYAFGLGVFFDAGNLDVQIVTAIFLGVLTTSSSLAAYSNYKKL